MYNNYIDEIVNKFNDVLTHLKKNGANYDVNESTGDKKVSYKFLDDVTTLEIKKDYEGYHFDLTNKFFLFKTVYNLLVFEDPITEELNHFNLTFHRYPDNKAIPPTHKVISPKEFINRIQLVQKEFNSLLSADQLEIV